MVKESHPHDMAIHEVHHKCVSLPLGKGEVSRLETCRPFIPKETRKEEEEEGRNPNSCEP
jgi:hypothetical protein